MKGYKGFDTGMVCRGKQYAEHTDYEEPTAELCKSGMHFCQNPMDVLDFYPLIRDDGTPSDFAAVEAPDDAVKTDGKKAVTTNLHVGAKLSMTQFINAAVDFTVERTKDIADSGNWAQIGSSGDGAKIGSSGNGAKIGSSGNGAKIGSSGYGAQIGSSGDGAKIGSSGDWAKINISGKRSVGAAIGINSCAKADLGNWIVLAEWKTVDNVWTPVCVKAAQVDGTKIKADVSYMLKDGEFVEAE